MNKTILMLLAPLALAGCADTPAQSFAKAKAEFAAHDYAAARIHIAAALSGQPGDKAMLLLQARTLLALGDGDGAGAALSRLSGKAPPEGELAELSAEAALLRKAPDAALQFLGKSDSSEAHRLRALVALLGNDSAAAQTHFEAATAKGDNARALADYARFRLMAGDVAGADDLSARALRLDPQGIDPLLVGALVAVRHGDLARALDIYARTEKLYPASLAAVNGRAAVLGDLGRFDEMDKAIDRAARMAPRDPTVLYLKAKAAVARKDWNGVRSLVQPIESEVGQLDPLRLIYAEALLRLGQSQLAVAQIQPIVRAYPGNRDAVHLLAEAQLAGGDARGAVDTLRPLADSAAARNEDLLLMVKAAREAGDPGLATYEARSRQPAIQALGRDISDADAAMQAGNWAGAVEAYKRLLSSTDGKNVVALNNMAYAQLMLGNHAAALDYAGRALKIAPNNPSVLDTAGWALFKSGKDLQTARRQLRRAAQLAPQNATIRAHLAEAERAPG